MHFDNEVARGIVAVLAGGPQKLRDMEGAARDVVTSALALAAAGIIRPVGPGTGPVEALNTALDEIDTKAAPFAARALSCGTALELESALRHHLREGQRLPRRLAAWPDFFASAAGVGRR